MIKVGIDNSSSGLPHVAAWIAFALAAEFSVIFIVIFYYVLFFFFFFFTLLEGSHIMNIIFLILCTKVVISNKLELSFY